MGNKTFDFSSKKKVFFAPKRPNLAQNWHFWSIWARPCRLIQCPVVGRLVVLARGLYLARHLFTLCNFLCTSENWRLGSYSKSWRSRWLESCSVPVEGGRDKQHQPSHPRWIDVAKKPKTSNRRAERDVELLCESCNDKTHTTPG